MRHSLAIFGAACVLAGAATSAVAGENELVRAFGDKLAVTEVQVSIGDGLIPVYNDKQAVAYLAKQMPADQKARFDSFVASRKMSDDLAGERLGEFFASENIADRLKDGGTPSRSVRLSITIDSAKFPVMKLPGQALPILNTNMSGVFKVQDAVSGEVLAEGRIIDSVSFAADMLDARKRNALKVLNFGRDDHLQVLAGASNGLARDAQALLREASLGRMSAHRIDGVEVQQATFEIRVSQPATHQES